MSRFRLLGGVAGRALLGAMTPAERKRGRYMRAPDGHDGGGGGSGGAADLLDDPNAADPNAADPNKADPNAADPNKADPNAADPNAALPAWASGVSTTAVDKDTASNADWLKSKGFKDLDGFVKSARDTEKAFHDKGAVKIPGEGAKPEEIAAFRKATGVPDKAEDYVVELPDLGEGADKLELDTAFVDPMKQIAHKAGMSAAAFKEFGAGYVQYQLDAMANAVKAQDQERDDLFKEWGPNKNARLAEFRAGAKLLGLDRAGVAAWQSSAGSKVVMTKLAELGARVSEDLLAGNEDATRYGVGSLEDAQGQIDAMIKDTEVQAKLKAKDGATVAKWNRLNAAIAAFKKNQAGK